MWLLLASIIAMTIFLFRNKRYRWFYILAKTYRRDFRLIKIRSWLSIIIWWSALQNKNIATKFSALVKKHPQKVAFYFEDEVWTFQKVENFVNKIARYFRSEGFQKGDCIALILENRPEYVCVWLGLSKVGVITSLINTNMVKEPLLHSLRAANCTAVIFGSSYADSVKYVLHKSNGLKFYQYHETVELVENILPNCADLRCRLESTSSDPLDVDYPSSVHDTCCCIYTSGTTGLPKAAVITHIRYMAISQAIYAVVRMNSDDIIYTSLPLYHTAGGVAGVGQTIVAGVTVVIKKKFSASSYWKDCARYNCTIAQYIGEICRYTLAASPKEPVKHSVRAIYGNGLKPQIWKQFVDQFGIREVYELYGATEGVANMANLDNMVGAVGFVPRYLRWAYPVDLIKYNEATGEPIRGKNRHCIRCGVNEAGLLVGKIGGKQSFFNFKGYVDKNETDKKILHNVFCDGDMYFNSGDMLLMDEFGYFFFKDRLGDTFRWKGENVSTCEIEAVISNLTQFNDAVLFGVEIPNNEGRAGMAAIVDTDKCLDLNVLGDALRDNLPSYAIPMFIRVAESLPLTTTFKLKKLELREEGYNIDKIKDTIYMYDISLKKYVLLTRTIYGQIVNGQIRF